MPAQDDNPRGYVELRDITDFNDRLLAAMGWTWDTPPPSPPSESPKLETLVTEGRDLLSQRLSIDSPWVLKDPRMALLLPWWRRIVQDRFVVVVPYRPPNEVAWSLHLRNGFSFELGLSLWAAYHRHMAQGLAGLGVVVANYAAITLRPRQVVPAVLSALRDLGADGDLDVGAACDVVERHLRRATMPSSETGGLEAESVHRIDLQWVTDAVSIHERFAITSPPASPWEVSLLEGHGDAARKEVQLGAERRRFADEQRRSADLQRRFADEQRRSADLQRRSADLQRRLADVEQRLAAVELERNELAGYLALAARLSTEILAAHTGPLGWLCAAVARLESGRPRLAHVTVWPVRSLWRILSRARLGRHRECPLFDPNWYVSEYADARDARNPWTHYRTVGAARGYRPNEIFDPSWYLQRYPDVAQGGVDAVWHYYKWGAAEGRDPGPSFSTCGYLILNPDVARSRINPLLHYIRHGRAECRTVLPARQLLCG